MNQHGKHVYRFGPFRIDRDERLLRQDAEVVPLTPKAVETLLVLAASGGRVVEKDELIRAVWPDSFVEEGSLARNVSALRKALGGGAADTDYIETIARRGYRFTAPVSVEYDGAPSAGSLAVLPLVNLSGDPSQIYFADGMTDELISYFLKIEALNVSSRTSVMAYRDARKPLREIARELGVNWVVEGTVLQSAGRVRISVRLIDGLTEKHLWSETYERDMRDVLALQSAVAGDISREIRIKLTPPEKAKLAQSRSVSPEAYQDYLRGRFFWNQRTAEGLRKARECFGHAIGEDPSYAPAHCGLADTWAMMGSSGYDLMPPREAMPRARAAALSALEIDNTLAEAHATLGYVKLAYDWDLPGAELELARAIELKPNYAITWQWQGELLMARSRPDEATKAFRHALELDPLAVPCNLGLGWSYYFCGKHDLAISQFLRALEMAPSVPMALYGLGLAYQLKGQHRKGLGEFRKAYKSPGGKTAGVMLMGVSHALEGRRRDAEKELAKLRGLAGRGYVPAVYEAFIYVALDDLDKAFEALQRACEERSSFMIFLNVQPSFGKLRLDRRYEDLMKSFSAGQSPG
jgi:TolB-like protein/Flp pilus assembly protein TadD